MYSILYNGGLEASVQPSVSQVGCSILYEKWSQKDLFTSYFQNCKMIVKWYGNESSKREVNGEGPQGALCVILDLKKFKKIAPPTKKKEIPRPPKNFKNYFFSISER